MKPTALASRAPDAAIGGSADSGKDFFTRNSIRLMKTKSLAIGILSSSVDYSSSSAGPRPQIEFEASWQRSAISIEISVHGAQNWFLGRLALHFRAR